MALLCLGFPLKEKGSSGSKFGTLSCCLAYMRCQTGAGDLLMASIWAIPAHPHHGNCSGRTAGAGDAKRTEVTNGFVAYKPKTTNVGTT